MSIGWANSSILGSRGTSDCGAAGSRERRRLRYTYPRQSTIIHSRSNCGPEVAPTPPSHDARFWPKAEMCCIAAASSLPGVALPRPISFRRQAIIRPRPRAFRSDDGDLSFARPRPSLSWPGAKPQRSSGRRFQACPFPRPAFFEVGSVPRLEAETTQPVDYLAES